MIYNISSNNSFINWNAKGDERILQNVRNILNTMRYEVAYDRVMGRDTKLLDKPMELVESSIIAETYELIEEYEPRAKVIDVTIEKFQNGESNIKVVLEIE